MTSFCRFKLLATGIPFLETQSVNESGNMFSYVKVGHKTSLRLVSKFVGRYVRSFRDVMRSRALWRTNCERKSQNLEVRRGSARAVQILFRAN